MNDSRIKCEICASREHSIQIHLRDSHPNVSLDDYRKAYPEAPLLSDLAMQKLAEKAKQKDAALAADMAGVAKVIPMTKPTSSKKPFHEVFGFTAKTKGALSANGEPIMIYVGENHGHPDMVPPLDPDYVFDLDTLKNAVLAKELNIPMLIWGHKGCGKTTLAEQVCARTNQPALRVQHTINTEESHVVGQWIVKGGQTLFELGPLPLAMLNGWTYIADEYDFGLPSVLAVYQSVLEGKSLVIKEADAAHRIIQPHPNFRFVATGNTNGSGDETGLYQGTQMQNAANYDRFGMVIHMKYMRPEFEVRILVAKAGIEEEDAKKLVDFGKTVRESYDAQRISNTISPRGLLHAAAIALRRNDFRVGIQLAFTNKLSQVDREAVEGIAQRFFGG